MDGKDRQGNTKSEYFYSLLAHQCVLLVLDNVLWIFVSRDVIRANKKIEKLKWPKLGIDWGVER